MILGSFVRLVFNIIIIFSSLRSSKGNKSLGAIVEEDEEEEDDEDEYNDYPRRPLSVNKTSTQNSLEDDDDEDDYDDDEPFEPGSEDVSQEDESEEEDSGDDYDDDDYDLDGDIRQVEEVRNDSFVVLGIHKFTVLLSGHGRLVGTVPSKAHRV